MFFAGQSSVVTPEWQVPIPGARIMKRTYMEFKEAHDPGALEEDRAILRRRIQDLMEPVWPLKWSGQVVSCPVDIADWITPLASAQIGNKNARTLLVKLKNATGTAFFKGPCELKAAKTQG